MSAEFKPGAHRLSLICLAAVALALTLAPQAGAAAGTFDRAWGKNVNGGGVFGICTVPASCLAGTTGGLGGDMNFPRGVALDSVANVYVADQSNNRIQVFNSSGAFLRAWGKNVNGGGVFGVCTVAASCQAGASGGLGGEMATPIGVAVDASNNVYVTDALNSRIQKFSSLGVWERAWGKNVNGGGVFETCTVAASCQAATAGTLGGEMNIPAGLATDASANVYVADANNNRIQKFDSSGTFLRTWGKNVNGGGVFETCTVAASCQTGTAGGLGGEMDNPRAVAIEGPNVYVAQGSGSRIQKFDTSGTWDRAWGKNVNGGGVFGVCTVASSCLAGTNGGLGGEMNFPTGLATDTTGNVYVGDQSNNRIQKFTSAGAWLRAWGKNVNGGGVFGVCTVAASCQAGTTGGLGGEMSAPSGVAIDSSLRLYIGDLVNNRVQRFDTTKPTISTQATANQTLGGDIGDQATLSGGDAPTGSITFTAYGPGDATCAGAAAYTSSAVTVSGNGPYGNSPVFTPGAVGTYRWRASYSGDMNNPAVSTPCNDTSETSVVKATPTLPTQATASVSIGGSISDQATLGGGSTPTGTITFTAYAGDATCATGLAYTSDPITVSGNGMYSSSPTFTPTTAGLYYWQASYSGDANNNAVETPCNDTNEVSTVTQATPTISTQATASVTLGAPIADQATLAGGSVPTGSITFTVYGPNDPTCAGAAVYTSNPVPVSGNGAYNNAPAFTPGTAGTYRWRAAYGGDANNSGIAGACNDPNETSVVNAVVIPPVVTPPVTTPAPGPTGQRAAALKKCKKKQGRARRNCKKKANKLPV